MEVAAGETIELTFESFDIESHRNCAYDYVLVSYGSVEQKYCGSTKPDPVISSGNTLTVTFYSDYSVNLNGFKATWKVAETSGSHRENVMNISRETRGNIHVGLEM